MVPETLGPYRLLGKIGEGGMGEVYRATDTNLKRQVAIKVLPASVAADADRLARFQREAEVLAVLNHPNIAAIYGLEKTPECTALVMELVEGEDLSQRIARLRAQGASAGQAGMPIDEVLPIARQIAEALEAAHEQGIIHRDLKPANIKVRADGTVKVLDFGLAKALGPEGPSATAGGVSASMSPTLTTSAMTAMGMILGTAAYMAPEQARGRAVDRRADIWAFGVVLYEMLTGRRAFEGEDISVTLANVIKDDPTWEALPPDVPVRVRRVLQACLRKDPRQRLGDMQSIRLALDGAFEVVVERTGATNAPRPAPPLWRRAAPWAAGLLAAVASGVGAWQFKPVSPQPVIRTAHTLPVGQSFRGTGRRYLAIAPDGSRFVYNATGGLYVRDMDALEARLIPGTEGAGHSIVFSPDGQSLAYFQPGNTATGGQVKRIAIAGGAATVLTTARTPFGMSWSDDGTILYSAGSEILQVSANGGEPERVATADPGFVAIDPQRLPGTDWVLFSLQPESGTSRESVTAATRIAAASRSGELRTIRTGGTSARYLATGHVLYTTNATVHAAPFDVRTLQFTGRPVPVVDGVEVSSSGQAEFDVSSNGTLVYVPGTQQSGVARMLAQSDRAGTRVESISPVGAYDSVRASHDGRRLAVGSDDGKEAIIWIHDRGARSAMRRLTFDGRNRFPVWSPDDRRIAFQSERDGRAGIVVKQADGTGEAVRLTTPKDGESHVPESWSPDGRYLSFDVVAGREHSLWILTLADGTMARFSDRRSAEPFGSGFSPDGRWLAYHALPGGESPLTAASGVYVESFPATGARYQAPKLERDFQPVWSPDGKELLYVPSLASRRLAITRVSVGSGVTFGDPELVPFDMAAGHLSARWRAFDVLPGGGLVGLIPPASTEQGRFSIRYVVNWFEELQKLVPVK
ncbi:hypothetical protein TBR22_A15830 [Luteitalea sp. TBR-22]|uniref:protein kinase domain-containing protein n=1 Tax=Luteitalea sp. TBR-22 TaxID=2802971 RepID=UPI001AF9EA4B|nr:protein kinase [Luteitalea sp. TBR-22]BCS32373.1 hypothetical protein TBR22_A15830 [Luteitalea sp. TBR-22]